VPQEYLDQFPDWPRNEFTGRPMAPAYMMSLANPQMKECSIDLGKISSDSDDYKVSTRLHNSSSPPQVTIKHFHKKT
jgi:hypothetical protein